tara:strand:+ start:273 stop:410 length:138 start_codon:yes stop_codon:yes gene_type:complete
LDKGEKKAVESTKDGFVGEQSVFGSVQRSFVVTNSMLGTMPLWVV